MTDCVYFLLFLFFSKKKNHIHVYTFIELLSSWESLLHWSENESFVKQSQEEMAALIDKLNKIGTSEPNLDTESAIQFAIQEAKVSQNAQFSKVIFMVKLGKVEK